MPHIRKISEGKYLIRVSKGTGAGRTYENKTFRGPLKAARQEAAKMALAMDSGESPKSKLLFGDYFEMWLKAIATKVRPRTYDGYKAYIARYAKERLKKFSLKDIRPHHVQQIYLDIDKSPGTVRQLHASLNACFGWAVKREYIRRNPCKNADLPQRNKTAKVVLMPDEAFRFVEICREMPYGIIFEFALETGMRPEEYLALRWRDIRNRNVSVEQIVQYRQAKGEGFYFAPPKTSKSRRMIDISENLRLRLVQHRREQNEHRMKVKTTWFNHDLVFPNQIGNPFTLTNLTRRGFRKVLEKMWPSTELPDGTILPHPEAKKLTLYSLRHTCATLLLMSNKNPKVVSDRLGHSSVVLTLDTYSHVLPHIQEDATNALDSILRFRKQA